MGNSGDDDLWPDVEKLSQSPDATLRLAPAGALRRMSPTATGAGFAKWLARREDGDVLRRLVEGYDLALLSGGNAAPPVVLGAIVKRLHETADDRLRQALIRLLGGLAAQQPAAKQALVEAFRREWNPRSKQLIGVYVDADSLTAAP